MYYIVPLLLLLVSCGPKCLKEHAIEYIVPEHTEINMMPIMAYSAPSLPIGKLYFHHIIEHKEYNYVCDIYEKKIK